MKNLHLFRPSFLYTETIDNHKNLTDELIPHILEITKNQKPNSTMWNCNCYTSFNSNNHSFLYDKQILNEIIWDPLRNLYEGYLMPFLNFEFNPKLINIWFNYYESEYFQEIHHHLYDDVHNVISGIYLLHLFPGTENTTEFHHIDPTFFLSESLKSNIFEEGTVFLFPASLHHEVKPSQGKKISISFNISLDGILPSNLQK